MESNVKGTRIPSETGLPLYFTTSVINFLLLIFQSEHAEIPWGENQQEKAHTVEETRKRKTGPLLSVTDPE